MKHALALCLVLAGCGGGGDAQTPVPGPQVVGAAVAVRQCRDVRVILFGDSVMQGSVKYTLDASGRSALQRYIDAHSTRHVVIVDRSAPGTTSTQLVAGWDGVNQGPAWPHPIDGDVIVVNHGLNDAARVTGADYEHNLRIVASVGVPVVFQTPTPTPDPAQDTKGYAEIMRTAASETHNTLADVYAYVTAQPNWQPMIWDGAHPTYDLYMALENTVVGPALLPLVEATACN